MAIGEARRHPSHLLGAAGAVRVPFLDLRVQDATQRGELVEAIETVLDHGRIVLGPEVEEFEDRVRNFCQRRYAIGVGSGTDALILGLKAARIGPGDEVITTPLSWLATAGAILLIGATPVFCDIDETLNMDPATLEPLINARTKAILPVHFTGRLAQMDKILQLAKHRGLLVLEDGAQAFGATWRNKTCGSFGDLACLSFNAMKILGALGDAGMVLCDDVKTAERLVMLRHSGVSQREYCLELSHNCRLDTLQAAVLMTRFARFPDIIARRREIADYYSRELKGVVETPVTLPHYRDAFYTYTVRTPRRDQLRDYLAARGIETRIQHSVLMYDQPAFQGKVRGKSPVAERLVKQILCIPVHEKLSFEDQNFVVDAIRSFFGGEA